MTYEDMHHRLAVADVGDGKTLHEVLIELVDKVGRIEARLDHLEKATGWGMPR